MMESGKIFIVILLVFIFQVSAITMEDLVDQGRAQGSFPDFLITKHPGLTIEVGETLYLYPGTNIIFANSKSLTVKGDIIAIGSEENPISFLGLNDDFSAGRYTFSGKNSESVLQNCKIYVGRGLNFLSGSEIKIRKCEISSEKGTIQISQSKPEFTGNNIIIRNPYQNSISIEDSNPIFNKNNFSITAFSCSDTKMQLTNNIINGRIFCSDTCQPRLSNNTIYFAGNRHWNYREIRWEYDEGIRCTGNFELNNQLIDTTPYSLNVYFLDDGQYNEGDKIRLRIEPENREVKITYANETKIVQKSVEFIAQKNKRQIKAELDGQIKYFSVSLGGDSIIKFLRYVILLLVLVGFYLIVRFV